MINNLVLKASTPMACVFSLLKVSLSITRNKKSPVYTCFLVVSKAFDRINHWTLFHKLINCNIPLIIVQLFIFWYQTQLVCIKWGKSTSDYFNISNGARQGGILSPRLFVLYLNSLTNKLAKRDAKLICNLLTMYFTQMIFY